MSGSRVLIIGIIWLSIFAFTISAYAGDEIEDLIEIAESKDKIIAIIEGKNTVTYNLRPNEKVLWSGYRGNIGAFLTDLHFYVISTTLTSWQALPMRVGESETAVASLSPFIALLVTGERAVGFDAASNRFIQVQLPIHDELLAAEVERYVAIVITSNRAFGFAIESSSFVEIILKKNETIETIKMTYRKATVRTSDRLLSFEAEGSIWRELRL
jgi:hypothetical protein